MIRKLLLVVLVAAATALGLWRLGVLDGDRVKEKAAELKDGAEESARRAAGEAVEKGREAVEKGRDAVEDARRR